ncbi:MAG TPA: rhomboid family intramembrane serine protease [Haliangium sp.]|nr:rhomboid family intramembrane serine protease [Haliangium sp.]
MSNRRQFQGRRLSFRQMRITRGAMYLLFAEVGLSLVYLLSNVEARGHLASWLVASADQVWRDLKIWTLLTSAVFEIDFVALIFHGLILWMFMPTLERAWGTRKFLLFALWTSLAGNIVGTLAGLALGDSALLTGLDPFVFASFVAFGTLYAKQPVQFFGVIPMTGKQMMIGICAFVGLFILIGQQWVLGASYVGAMVTGWLLVNGTGSPRLWYTRWKHRRARRRLSVVRGGASRDQWLN